MASQDFALMQKNSIPEADGLIFMTLRYSLILRSYSVWRHFIAGGFLIFARKDYYLESVLINQNQMDVRVMTGDI